MDDENPQSAGHTDMTADQIAPQDVPTPDPANTQGAADEKTKKKDDNS